MWILRLRNTNLAVTVTSAGTTRSGAIQMTDKTKSLKGVYNDQGMYLAMEWGFKAAEKGWNLEKATEEWKKVMYG